MDTYRSISSTARRRYVQGNRVLVPPDDERRSITILDFNTNLAPFQDDVGNDFNIYCQPLRHILLPRRWTLALKTTCSSFLIGEDFVLGLRVRTAPVYPQLYLANTTIDVRKLGGNDWKS